MVLLGVGSYYYLEIVEDLEAPKLNPNIENPPVDSSGLVGWGSCFIGYSYEGEFNTDF